MKHKCILHTVQGRWHVLIVCYYSDCAFVVVEKLATCFDRLSATNVMRLNATKTRLMELERCLQR